MFRIVFLIFTFNFIGFPLISQELGYYLPQSFQYHEKIPTPQSVIGHQVGEWHVSHDKLVNYMYAVAAASDRVSLEVYGHTYEKRPLLLLTVTSPQNHENIGSIREQHLQLSDHRNKRNLDVTKMPVVVWMGYSVHGNEASGSNASMLALYHLAAAQGPEIDDLLNHTIILIDPSINPDGLNRFASWVNSHRSKNLDEDPQSLEHNEAWPRGRTNHYWFDLNRDWLPIQHPETQGRLGKFHQWKPNILTDHHEMGSDRTFFFQPGEPSRNHPLTPERTFELTHEIAKYHAEALDQIGSLYYTGEGYDDFYYGKGSTYPDVNGGIGILFEQASARGHLRDTENGQLTFPFAIRNQFTTSLSTVKAARALRTELLEYQREFYQTALQQAQSDEVKAYLIQENDEARMYHFLKMVQGHQIEVYRTNRSITVDGNLFHADRSYVIPLDQGQYRLIKAIFEQRTSFTDSLFYDVSGWTLPLAFNLEFSKLDRRNYQSSILGSKLEEVGFPHKEVIGAPSGYGYIFEWNSYYAPRALNRILNHKLRAKVATEAMILESGESMAAGTILIPVVNQNLSAEKIFELMEFIAREDGIAVRALAGGYSTKGKAWGSPTLENLTMPKVLLLAGEGISGYEVGEVWHLLDQRFNIKITLAPQHKFGALDLNKYNTMVMVSGQYRTLNSNNKEKLKQWVAQGGNLISWRTGAKWLSDSKIGNALFSKEEIDTVAQLEYGDRDKHTGAQEIGGAIFEALLDLTHPLAFGFERREVPVFRNSTLLMDRSKNPFTNPIMYSSNPLLSGYIHEKKLEKLKNTPAVTISHEGSGRIIYFTDNPNFRAFWLGTNKLFLNALFFGPIIESKVLK